MEGPRDLVPALLVVSPVGCHLAALIVSVASGQKRHLAVCAAIPVVVWALFMVYVLIKVKSLSVLKMFAPGQVGAIGTVVGSLAGCVSSLVYLNAPEAGFDTSGYARSRETRSLRDPDEVWLAEATSRPGGGVGLADPSLYGTGEARAPGEVGADSEDGGVRSCPECGHPYSLRDYDREAPRIFCANCFGELCRG